MSDDDPLIGRQLAGFRLDRVLGRGGMATVYYGWDVNLERTVAVKVIDARHQRDAGYTERFVNEARLIAAWHHPNVLQVHYAGDENGLYFFVMEYIRGSDLDACLNEFRREGRLMPLDDVLRIGRAVAAALDHAHEYDVIHRDVKPSNVLLADDGRVVLADFGLALNVTQGTLGTVFGSPHYIAPEQARNSALVVPQSDLYALGVMLYEMLTGRVPFDDPSPAALAMQHITREPPPPRKVNPALNGAVEAVLLKALRKKPRERFQTGHELMDALAAALEVPQSTMPFLEGTLRPGRRVGSSLRLALSRLRLADRLAALPSLRGVRARLALAADRLAAHPARLALAASLARAADNLPAHPAVRTLAARLAGFPPVARRALSGAAVRFPRNPAVWWLAGCVVGLLLVPIVALAGFNLVFGRKDEAGAQGTGPGTVSAHTATNSPDATERPSEAVPDLPAQGDYFVLYYDDTALYFQNLSGKDRSIFPIAFERLHQDGNPTNRFDGWRWGEIYGKHRAGYCAVVELIEYAQHLNPEECRNRYIVVRTPFSYEPHIFWTAQEGSEQFRVLWDENEVGRCEIAAHRCEVYLP